MKEFPRTTVGGVSVSRIIMGTNWIYGYSHTGASADKQILKRNSQLENVRDLLDAYMQYGIDTIMGPMSNPHVTMDAIKELEQKYGRKIIIIDTPIINVDDTAEGRKEAEKTIKRSKEIGATFCLIHHSSCEQLINKNKSTMDRLPDYLSMIRENDMVPGLSAHMPEVIVYSDLNNYDVETYIQIYNCLGFLMQVEVEYINKVIWSAKKPVMTIKPMAAGRTTPFVGLNFSFNTIREKDMVTTGCFTSDEVHEVVEISFAALERRQADLEGRNSPNKTSIMM